jgi:hypothetical protein
MISCREQWRIARTAGKLCAAMLLTVSAGLWAERGRAADAVRVRAEVRDEQSGQAVASRIYVQDEKGGWHFPEGDGPGDVVLYKRQNYWDESQVEMHATAAAKPVEYQLPPGEYAATVERGKEYVPLETKLKAGDGAGQWQLPLTRWIDMASHGWYSGDTHCHRSIDEIGNLMLAEDVNVCFPLTYWTTIAERPPSRGDKTVAEEPPIESVAVDATHVWHPRNTEYEIFETAGRKHTLGAFLILNHRRPFAMTCPPMAPVAKQAREEGALIDLEKHNWEWAAVAAPTLPVDLFELANNHNWRIGFGVKNWGAPAAEWMGLTGPRTIDNEPDWLEYGWRFYYALLNSGLAINPTAGSASGAHPVPLGYSRVYVRLADAFSYDAWVAGLKAGRSFVTTGPMLMVTVNGRDAGERFRSEGDSLSLRVEGEIQFYRPVERIEIVWNGEVVRSVEPRNERVGNALTTKFETTLPADKSGWLAVRCVSAPLPAGGIPFAHTAPWHVEIAGRPLRPRRREVEYFLGRVEEEIERNRDVLQPVQMADYTKAREFWQEKLATCEENAATPSEARQVSPKQKTGFTLVQDQQGWSLVSPEGQKFFSRGVCVVTQGTPREKYDPERPAYAAWRHYDSPLAWADATVRRLKSWRFTTIGGWSDAATLNQSDEQTLWLTPAPHLGSTVGFPWWDMWDKGHLARMERLAVERIDPLSDDPRVIGYYSDNEMGWWPRALWKMTLEHEATSEQRRRLIKLLREIYRDSWEALTADFTPQGAASWGELERGGGLVHRPGGDGLKTMRRFQELLAERYYQLMRDTIRQHDEDALFLGDRYQSFYYPEVARICGKYVDVASTNLNASWNDGRFVRCQLDSLHRLTGKPMLVTEFYMAATENRSGNKNAASGFPVVATQAERAAAARTTLEAVTAVPYVVGVDWFQYYDEPPHGRFDGEDYNFGLVDIEDRPYEELTAAFAEFDAEKFRSERRPERANALAGAPPAPADPFAKLRFMHARKHWDRERGFVPAASEAPLGDLYICWNPQAVFVGLYVLDPVESEVYTDRVVPEADRAEWTVQLEDGQAITSRIGGAKPAAVTSDPQVRVECPSALDGNPRLIAVMEIPAARCGRERFAAGEKIELQSSLVTHGHTDKYQWTATLPLAK